MTEINNEPNNVIDNAKNNSEEGDKTTTGTESSNTDSTSKNTRTRGGWIGSFGAQIVMGFILGILLGLIARQLNSSSVEPSALSVVLSEVGSAYVTLLKTMVPPLIIAAVITSVANLRKVTNAAQLAVSTLVWFIITAFFSVSAGILVGIILKPGLRTTVPDTPQEPGTVGSWWSFLQSVLPDNILGLGVSISSSGEGQLSFQVLQLLVISLVLGAAAVKTGKKAEPFLGFMESFLAIVQTILWWIIRLAPIGTAALIGHAVADYGWDALSSLGAFVLAIYIGLALVLLVIYPAVLSIHGLSVRKFYQKVWPVTSLGFVTRSSMGVMPVNQRITEERMGVPSEYASFAIPLGATTKMDGCAAVYPAVSAIFIAQFYGIDLSIQQYLLIIAVSVFGSAATAGTTGATVMLTLTLSTLGLPLAGVGLLLAVEPIVDMGRTAVNVTGQSLVATVVSRRHKILNQKMWA